MTALIPGLYPLGHCHLRKYSLPVYNLTFKNLIMRLKIYAFGIFIVALLTQSCNKLVEVPPPVSTITTTQTFADSIDAQEAILGIYSTLINTGGFNPTIGSGGVMMLAGLSSDELVVFGYSNDYNQLYTNTLLPFNNY